jgi:hypothetical protein
METLLLAVIAALAAFGIQSSLPPDVSACRLSHSFVLGEPWEHPGAIEIWACPSDTVVTLTQFLGPWNERERNFRGALKLEVPQDERIVGCKNYERIYDGVIASTPQVHSAQPLLSRAWKADLDKWTIDETDAAAVVCNRDFGLD